MKALTVGITEPDSIQWTSFLPPKTVTATECLRKAKDQVHGFNYSHLFLFLAVTLIFPDSHSHCVLSST